jgi:hypothetical protein
LTGRRIRIQLYHDDRVDDIREKIRAKEGIHPDQQLLLYNGMKLIDNLTVKELYIIENTVLFLTLRNRGG